MTDCSILSARLRRRTARPVMAFLMGTVLVGCAVPGFGPGVSRYEPTYLRMTGEREFAQSLRQRYLELATNAFDRGDSARSDFYSLRALMAAEGKLAQPVERSGGGEIAAAGARLSQLLMTGVRTGSPDLAARAQAAYDCWLIESGSDGDPQIAQACRYNAMQALAELEGASTGARLAHAGPAVSVETQTITHGHSQAPAVVQSHTTSIPSAPVAPIASHGQTQSYVVQPGGQGQTIHAPGGYTIQVITTTHAPVVAPAPAHYTTVVPHAAPQVIQSVPIIQQQAPAVQFVETAPIVEEFMAPEVISPVAVNTVQQSLPPVEIAMAPPAFVEAAPIVETIQAAPIVRAPAPVPTIDLGPLEAPLPAPIQTVPVFDTEPVASLPSIEISPLPIFDNSDAARALVEAGTNMGGDFSVFFGFDSDEVTIEAEDVLVDVIERFRLSGARRINLAGFTDSMGDARYNQLLAMRRAQAVRKFLQERIGNDATFEILPVGELQAVQSGGDGVNEALNRKVQISLQ